MPSEGKHELFLKFLPVSATEASVRNHFAECQSLQSVRLSRNKETGDCKGTGWLVLGDLAEAEWLVKEWNAEPYNEMDGRHVEISHAVAASSTWRPKPILGKDIPCRYGATCVRRDCTFQHPASWDPKLAKEKNRTGGEFAPGRIVCKYGEACKHPNCFFAHPGGRVYDGTCTAKNSDSSDTVGRIKAEKTISAKQADAAADGDNQVVETAKLSKKKKAQKNKSKELEPLASDNCVGMSGTPLGETGLARTKKVKRKKDESTSDCAQAPADEKTLRQKGKVKRKLKKKSIVASTEVSKSDAIDRLAASVLETKDADVLGVSRKRKKLKKKNGAALAEGRQESEAELEDRKKRKNVRKS
mmetsp:Transcript_120324/g.190629  ORF Transcript_120324/g.190629 Transcript_120324/m.190629 type:complete len:358 (-) Transcript_120324:10-1083(-)